jgi:hypothetical protein
MAGAGNGNRGNTNPSAIAADRRTSLTQTSRGNTGAEDNSKYSVNENNPQRRPGPPRSNVPMAPIESDGGVMPRKSKSQVNFSGECAIAVVSASVVCVCVASMCVSVFNIFFILFFDSNIFG